MRPLYYDRDGIPIDQTQWARLSFDSEYKRVDRTDVFSAAEPDKQFTVSTVWLGLDHGFIFDGPPIIFETMVFGDSMTDLDCRRYATLKEAREGHRATVVLVAATLVDPVIMDAV